MYGIRVLTRGVFATFVLAAGGIMASLDRVNADEGMWLFNDLPLERLESKYGFQPTAEWANHLMKASVRFNSGGSASFISSHGLVLTNHHVGADTLHKISTPENNYYKNGFLANSYEEEIAAPDLELNQLISLEDVTRASPIRRDGHHESRRGGGRPTVHHGADREGIARQDRFAE